MFTSLERTARSTEPYLSTGESETQLNLIASPTPTPLPEHTGTPPSSPRYFTDHHHHLAILRNGPAVGKLIATTQPSEGASIAMVELPRLDRLRSIPLMRFFTYSCSLLSSEVNLRLGAVGQAGFACLLRIVLSQRQVERALSTSLWLLSRSTLET